MLSELKKICKACNSNTNRFQGRSAICSPCQYKKRKAEGKLSIRTRENIKKYNRTSYKNGKDAGKQWTTKEVQKNNNLKKFGISLDEYNVLLHTQNYVCAICHQPETKVNKGKVMSLAVDHCHKTGLIRGLLCFDCNTTLGKLKENKSILENMLDYLNRG